METDTEYSYSFSVNINLQISYLWKAFSINMVHHDYLIIEGDTWTPRAAAETTDLYI